jgi:hypothetical protein
MTIDVANFIIVLEQVERCKQDRELLIYQFEKKQALKAALTFVGYGGFFVRKFWR